MKAAICTRYGPPEVLQIEEVPLPQIKENEVLIRVAAFPVTTPDRRIRGIVVPFPVVGFIFKIFLRAQFGFMKPKLVLGSYLAGRIEAVGSQVTGYQVGDEVFAFTGAVRGAYAEYSCLSEDAVMALKPQNLSFEQSAALPYGGLSALCFLNRIGGIKEGQKVLIIGASGSIGSSVVQLAKHYGAEVWGMCRGERAELVKSLGADHIIDFETTDFTKGSMKYDLVFDAAGASSAAKCKGIIAENGNFLTVFSSVTILQKDDLELLKNLAEQGEFKPLIDRSYAFEEIAAAHRYADEGHPKGAVLVLL